MKDKREFLSVLRAIHGLPAAEYGRLVGDYDFARFVIHLRRAPTVLRGEVEGVVVVHVPQIIAGFPPHLISTPMRRTALEDYLGRRLGDAVARRRLSGAGSAVPEIRLPAMGCQVLPRSLIVAAADFVEARLTVRLPLRDGMVDSDVAERVFFHDLPQIVNDALIHCYLDGDDLDAFVNLMEDAEQARRQLTRRGLVALIGEGARPDSAAPPLVLPETGLTELDVPNAGTLRGLGVPTGITLIIGDPHSGRQALIAAIAQGAYNHIPGDGRERIIAIPDIVRVDADPGRPVRDVDLSAFGTAGGAPARPFSSNHAPPAESQMAGVIEAILAGAQALVVDEATSDPAFLAGDVRLGGLRPAAAPTFLSLANRAREIANDLRVSLVIGAFAHAREFLGIADTVLFIEQGAIRDVTADARALARDNAMAGPLPPLPSVTQKSRWIIPSSIDPSLGAEEAVISAPDPHTLQFGRYRVDLGGVPQLVDIAQVNAIGLLLYHARMRHLDEPRTVAELLDLLDEDLATEGLDMLSRDLRGDLARPRRYEIAAALNRLPSLRLLRQPPSP
ncbi:MAG: ABC-ATPase domain-containing protein [Kiritimatiellae bacterium]|nr:ABC-ATPase domain-containing protein [Kiritimatiellia bacterium]